uniref:Uncharacterized protein n=1 Tax=Romanomermis culicivorax TaxID=13658 RepID=A0A915JVV7_ROMCU
MSNEEVTDEIFRPTFREQKKTVAAAITRSMTQKEEKSKLLSQNKVPTFEEDFQQPEKWLIDTFPIKRNNIDHETILDDQFFFADEYNIK